MIFLRIFFDFWDNTSTVEGNFFFFYIHIIVSVKLRVSLPAENFMLRNRVITCSIVCSVTFFSQVVLGQVPQSCIHLLLSFLLTFLLSSFIKTTQFGNWPSCKGAVCHVLLFFSVLDNEYRFHFIHFSSQ